MDLPLCYTNDESRNCAQADKGGHEKTQYAVAQVLPPVSWVTIGHCQFREDL